MRDHELDRILSSEQEIVPSPNFTRSVMDKVRMEASAPPPIPFPWKFALPGLVLCVSCLIAMCVSPFLHSVPQRPRTAPDPSIWTGLWPGIVDLLRMANVGGWGWILMALVLTYASVKLSLRFAGRRI